mgnify:CR=1 FL=1
MKRKAINMRTQSVVLFATVCLSIAVFISQPLSWASASNGKPMPLVPPAESLRGLSDEEKVKAVEKWRADRQRQEKQATREYINLMAREAWKRLLRINEQQWQIIEREIDKVYAASWPIRVSRFASRDDAGHLRWKRFGPTGAKTPQIAECCRVIDELIDLLEHEDSTDEQIRKKMDALEKVRADARKELAQIGRELAALPLTPRQEAIFLIMGYID